MKNKPDLVKAPRTERQFSPDVAECVFAPTFSRDWMMSCYGYRVVVNKGHPGGIEDGAFVYPMRHDLSNALRKHVLPSTKLDRKEPRRWFKLDYQTPWGRGHEKTLDWSLLVNPAALASPHAAFLAMLRCNLDAPTIFCRNSELMDHNSSPDEVNARGLLREIIGEEEYYNYLRSGFVRVSGRSGLEYVIRGGHSNVDVRSPSSPKNISERICVQFKQDMPYTDSVIMRVLLVMNDEMAMRAMSNVFREKMARTA